MGDLADGGIFCSLIAPSLLGRFTFQVSSKYEPFFYATYLAYHSIPFSTVASSVLLALPKTHISSTGLRASTSVFLNDILSLSCAEMQACCYTVRRI